MKYEIQFVMNIFEKLNLCEYLIHVFVSTNENRALILYFKKIISNNFVFFIKISCQSKESSFLSIPLLSPTAPFQEKIFHLHPYCQIRGS